MKQTLNYFAKVLHVLVACITIFVSCKEEPVPIVVSSITLDSTSMTLIEGETQTLTATISPSNAENQKVLWSSNNSSVASVKDGVVIAVKVGTATVTAKSDDGGKTATCTVTVESKTTPVIGITLDKTTYEMTEGDEFTLTAIVNPENATNKNVSWSSSDSSVATVDNGKVTAIKAGTVTITVKTEDGGKTAACEITVNAKVYPVIGITLDKTTYEMTEGDEFTLTAIVNPENATNKNVSWSSSDSSVATVDNGKVTAIKAGTATITVKTEDGGKTAACEVSILELCGEDLSINGTANSYIVTSAGVYEFLATKGVSNTPLNDASSVEILWESYGSKTTPAVGDLIKTVKLSNDKIIFKTADTFKEGNAVIAVSDAMGTILWSWHIWFTDMPQEQLYPNISKPLMDRNLGATSANSGEYGALGLLYQWGRKDPFLGSASISNNSVARSTTSWPSSVESNSSTGTIEYSISHPTTFITRNKKNSDWYYTGDSSTDKTRWRTLDGQKTIYDPCPPGWIVPSNGWMTLDYSDSEYDESKEGMEFGNSNSVIAWYPAAGARTYDKGTLGYVGSSGCYWSASYGSKAYCLYYSYNTFVYTSHYYEASYGFSVRCIKE